MDRVRVFAYGSNLSTRRLRRRTPSAQPIGRASLFGHVLRFHKRGRDGSATSIRPFHWYVRYVLEGAREHGLPDEWLDAIARVPWIRDPDAARAAANA